MRIAIIGAGPCGLSAIKCCLDEGLHPVCFELDSDIGGAWRFKEDPSKNSVYRSTVINTSKELSCFSDFLQPKDFPPFFGHRHMFQYYERFSRHFRLYNYIRFNSEVVNVFRTPDHGETGRWEVSYKVNRDGKETETTTEIYDALMVCSGHLWLPIWPSFRGMDKFKGRIIHSGNYRDFKGFEGKKILVIGLGNSAADIAVELSRHANQVYVSTRRGAWVTTRVARGGLPFDYWSNCRFIKGLPFVLQQWIFLTKFYKLDINYQHLGLLPETGYFSGATITNDELTSRIPTGTLLMKPNVDHFSANGVTFTDGTRVEDLDAVICCTGYGIDLKFLDESIISVENNELHCYKFVFPPDHSKQTLAFIGFLHIAGAMNPTVEMQCRWVTRVFKGLARLPSNDVMKDHVSRMHHQLKNQFGYKSQRFSLNADAYYTDDIAERVGCRPNLLKLFFIDPVLAIRCYIGPSVPAQYRLMGPGAWPGAKRVIEDAYINLIYPTCTRVVRTRPTERSLDTSTIKQLFLRLALLPLMKCIVFPVVLYFPGTGFI